MFSHLLFDFELGNLCSWLHVSETEFMKSNFKLCFNNVIVIRCQVIHPKVVVSTWLSSSCLKWERQFNLGCVESELILELVNTSSSLGVDARSSVSFESLSNVYRTIPTTLTASHVEKSREHFNFNKVKLINACVPTWSKKFYPKSVASEFIWPKVTWPGIHFLRISKWKILHNHCTHYLTLWAMEDLLVKFSNS